MDSIGGYWLPKSTWPLPLYCLSEWKNLVCRWLSEIKWSCYKSDEFPLPKQRYSTSIIPAANGCLPLMPCLDLLDGNRKNGTRKVGFTDHRGLWQFVRMPFGYKNGPVFSASNGKCSCTIPLDICLGIHRWHSNFFLTMRITLNIWPVFQGSEIRSNSRCDQMSFRIHQCLCLDLVSGPFFAWHYESAPVLVLILTEESCTLQWVGCIIYTTNQFIFVWQNRVWQITILEMFWAEKIVIL